MEGLLAALAESPDDLASWSVYGDFLQAHSDPRGELISLMLQRARQPSPRLYDAQRRYLARHAPKLVPDGIDVTGMAWRNGFVTELHIDAPDQLAHLGAEPALRFVETLTITVDGKAWPAWCAAAKDQPRWPWRRLTIELVNSPEELVLHHFVTPAPLLEHLRINIPEDDATTIVWDGVVAPALRRLVLVNAGRVDPHPAMPALRELWLLGASVASPALALERLVVANEAEADANVVAYRPRADVVVDEYRYEELPASNAFVILGQPIENALVEKLVARMTGLAQLSMRTAELWWQRRPVTVMQLYGVREPDAMLPYSLAVALGNVLAAPPPMVLVEVGDDRAQYLVLGDTQARGTLEAADNEPADIVRRAFDIAFGSDPGSAIVEDVRDALAVATEYVLVGSVTGERILNVIDPRATPFDTVDESDYDEDEEEDEDDAWDEPWQDDLERYEEPVPVARLVVKTDEDVWIEQGQAQEDEELGVPEPDEQLELTAIEVIEQPAEWFEFREHWDDRAGDPNDEPGEVRWPDPAVVENDVLDLERQIAEPACREHEAPLDACNWCNAPICTACNDTAPIEAPIDGVCPTCLAALERPHDPSPSSGMHPRGRVVS